MTSMEANARPSAPDSPTRVLLVDDHRMFTELMTAVMADHPDLDIVGVAADGEQGLERALAERPDVVVIDYQLPGADGLEWTRRLLDALPESKVLMLTGHDDDRLVREAVAAGCAGFLTKDRPTDDLVAAVRAVRDGGAAIGRAASPSSVDTEPGAGALPLELTRREVEVLSLLADGLSTRQLADRLFISVNTARNHVQRIIKKLDAHSRLEAVAIAARAGVVRMDRR